jgi:hypothetical protein
MNAQSKVEAAPLAKLREPFAPHLISKLPKPTKKQTDDVKADFKKGIRCQTCGSWHHPDVVHLDYVGHAALTDRLLDIDPCWTWEPVGFTPEGLPAHDRNGGLWIKLTVCGMTRYGYGCADGKQGGDAVKEIIGDALRNAAMRFGAALDLWHKGDLHPEDTGTEEAVESDQRGPEPKGDPVAMITDDQRDLIQTMAPGAGKTVQGICEAYKVRSLTDLTYARATKLIERLQADAKAVKETAAAGDILDDEIPY